MSDAPKTLFDIIDIVLKQFSNANLLSANARKSIADEICDRYYTQLEINNVNNNEYIKKVEKNFKEKI